MDFFAFKHGHFIGTALFSYVTNKESLATVIGNEEKLSLVGSTPGHKIFEKPLF
jgi:hypothetical protein